MYLRGRIVLKRILAHGANYLTRVTLLALVLLGAASVCTPASALADATQSSAVPSGVFAQVGESVVSHDEYRVAFEIASRGKFYHGKPPEGEIALLQREVGDQMVTRILLLREVERLGLRADAEAVQKKVESYEQRYAKSAQWAKRREQVLPSLIAKLEQDDVLSQLENSIRYKASVDEQQAKVYYEAHPDQFTQPEQIRLSVILLKVDPSSSSATWSKAEDQAKLLVKRAQAGEDFAELARLYSGDATAANGGDMGYLHSGMLPEGTQAALANLKESQTSDAIRLLEGFAVFRLHDRKAANLQAFDVVKVRARELAVREQGNLAWDTFVRGLKSQTTIKIDESRFLPLSK